MAKQIRIVLADDHPVVLKGLRMSVEEDPRHIVVGEAPDGEKALDCIRNLHPDLAILDINMPKLDGFAVARERSRLNFPTKIIFLTLHNDQKIFDAAIKLGVKGYLLKESAVQEIAAAIESVVSGRTYIGSTIAAQVMERQLKVPSSVDSMLGRLTPAERTILRRIASGKASKEIAEELSIHYRTVENHRVNACRKLGIAGSNALLRFAVQHKADL
jgi:DNA-binding NarL/FixJ family response regulator